MILYDYIMCLLVSVMVYCIYKFGYCIGQTVAYEDKITTKLIPRDNETVIVAPIETDGTLYRDSGLRQKNLRHIVLWVGTN